MKFSFKNRDRQVVCAKCGLGGLTLVHVGAKIKGKTSIYEHQTKDMCWVAEQTEKQIQHIQQKSMRARIKALKERLENGS